MRPQSDKEASIRQEGCKLPGGRPWKTRPPADKSTFIRQEERNQTRILHQIKWLQFRVQKDAFSKTRVPTDRETTIRQKPALRQGVSTKQERPSTKEELLPKARFQTDEKLHQMRRVRRLLSDKDASIRRGGFTHSKGTPPENMPCIRQGNFI